MAGGTWIDQNKVLPGVYINYSSAPSTLATMGERGVVCIPKEMSWGEEDKFIVINDPSECFDKLGYDQMSDELRWLRQILLGTNRTSGASKVLVWRLGCDGAVASSATESKTVAAASATVTLGNLTVTAKSNGAAGNKLAVEIIANASDNTKFDLKLYQGNVLKETETAVSTVSDLGTSEFVTYSGSGSLALADKTNLSGGADAFSGSLTVTAQDKGKHGDDISIVITADPDNNADASEGALKSIFYVQTLVSGKLVDTQTLKADAATVALSGLNDNAWVKFSAKTGDAFAASITLSGGSNGTLASSAYSDFMEAAELESWNVLASGTTNPVNRSALALFVKRLSNDEGKKVQAVLHNYPSADNECVISVYPQVIVDNSGHTFSEEEMVCWVAGCTAGANVNESLTYAAHPDAVSINPVLTQSQQIDAINAGQFALFEEFGSIKNIQDINTFTSFAATKGKAFRKNRVIRTLFGICNDSYRTYSMYYIGNTNNDAVGRGLLKAELLNLLLRYQGNNAIQNVVEDDVVVSPGQESDAVLIELYIQPIDSIEKIYINITIS